jgi:histidinol phosphatase-like enzyme
MWDDRYGKIEFAYGEQPNNFLKEQLIKIPAVLFPQRAKDETQFMRPHKAGMFMLLIKVSRVKESANTS